MKYLEVGILTLKHSLFIWNSSVTGPFEPIPWPLSPCTVLVLPIDQTQAREAWSEVHRSQLQLPSAQSQKRRMLRESKGDQRDYPAHSLTWNHYFLCTPLPFYSGLHSICRILEYFVIYSSFLFFSQWSVSSSPWNWWDAIYDFDHFKSTIRTKKVECSLLNSDCQCLQRKTGKEMELLFFRIRGWFACGKPTERTVRKEGTRQVHLIRAQPRERFSVPCLLPWEAPTHLRGVVRSQL